MKNLLGASWRTTALGLCTILTALSKAAVSWLDGDPTTNMPPGELMVQMVIGFGFMLARDNKTTSEQVQTQGGGLSNSGVKLMCLAFAGAALSVVCGCSIAKVHQRTQTTEYYTNGMPSSMRIVDSRTLATGDARQIIDKLKASNTKATLATGVEGVDSTVNSSNFWAAAIKLGESAEKIATSLAAPGSGVLPAILPPKPIP